jgi:hypothetical protein
MLSSHVLAAVLLAHAGKDDAEAFEQLSQLRDLKGLSDVLDYLVIDGSL